MVRLAAFVVVPFRHGRLDVAEGGGHGGFHGPRRPFLAVHGDGRLHHLQPFRVRPGDVVVVDVELPRQQIQQRLLKRPQAPGLFRKAAQGRQQVRLLAVEPRVQQQRRDGLHGRHKQPVQRVGRRPDRRIASDGIREQLKERRGTDAPATHLQPRRTSWPRTSRALSASR